MSELASIIGARIRSYRNDRNLSQERLAELAGCHPTYIGQLERGEKNATVESVAKIAAALDVPLSRLFEKLGGEAARDNIPLQCYELVAEKTPPEQKLLYEILLALDRYKNE